MAEERHSSERRFIVKVPFYIASNWLSCCWTSIGPPHPTHSSPPGDGQLHVGLGVTLWAVPHRACSAAHGSLICIRSLFSGPVLADPNWLSEIVDDLGEEETDEYSRFTLI